MLVKTGKRMRDFLEGFHFYFCQVFHILGAFLIKQLSQSRLLDMR